MKKTVFGQISSMGEQIIHLFYDVTTLITNVYIHNKIFSLAFYTHFCYHNRIIRDYRFADVFREGR